LLAQSREEFRRTVDFAMAKPPFIPAPVLDVMADRRIANAPLEQIIFKQLRSESVEERVRGLAVPALVVWGAQDRVIHPGTAGVIDQLLPNAEVILMPGIGHLPMLEAPEQVTADYLAFRGRLGG
jgi:pimeloyl-ACP methyl ester carboxylesterase